MEEELFLFNCAFSYLVFISFQFIVSRIHLVNILVWKLSFLTVTSLPMLGVQVFSFSLLGRTLLLDNCISFLPPIKKKWLIIPSRFRNLSSSVLFVNQAFKDINFLPTLKKELNCNLIGEIASQSYWTPFSQFPWYQVYSQHPAHSISSLAICKWINNIPQGIKTHPHASKMTNVWGLKIFIARKKCKALFFHKRIFP